jgi:hypothetical protein
MVRKQFSVGFYCPSELTIVVSIVVSSVACVGGLKEPLPMHKASGYLVVTYFATYLPIYRTYFLHNGLPGVTRVETRY